MYIVKIKNKVIAVMAFVVTVIALILFGIIATHIDTTLAIVCAMAYSPFICIILNDGISINKIEAD